MLNITRKRCRSDQIFFPRPDARIQTCLSLCVRSRGQTNTNFQRRLVCTVQTCPYNKIKDEPIGKRHLLPLISVEQVQVVQEETKRQPVEDFQRHVAQAVYTRRIIAAT